MRYTVIATALAFGCLVIQSGVQAAPKNSAPKVTSPAQKTEQDTDTIKANPKIWDKEPDSFLGIKFNEPLTVDPCPIKYINEHTESLAYDIMRLLPGVCIDPLDANYKYGNPDNNTLIIRNVPDIGVGYDVDVTIKNGVVAKFTIYLKQYGYLLLLSAFKERYGYPTSIENSTVKNNAGGEFNSLNAEWKGKKITISMRERYLMVDKSYVIIYDNATEEAETAKDRAKRASEAQKF